MKFKFKNTLLVSFLAIAGILGVSSALINKQVNQEPVAEKADAAYWGDWDLIIYHKDGTTSTFDCSKNPGNQDETYFANAVILAGEGFSIKEQGNQWNYAKIKGGSMSSYFTEGSGQVDCNTSGVYTFYQGVEAYNRDNGTWIDGSTNSNLPSDRGYYVVGTMSSWGYTGSISMTESDTNKAEVHSVYLEKDTEFKGKALPKGSNDTNFWNALTTVNDNCTTAGGRSEQYAHAADYWGGNTVVDKTSVFDIYWTSSNELSTALHEFVITLDDGSGSGGEGSKSGIYYGETMPLVTVPSRTGYTFDGYYTGTNGTGTKYYNADGTSATSWAETSTDTLYASWTAKTYSVTKGTQTNGTLTVDSTGTFDAGLSIKWAPGSDTGYTYTFSSVTVKNGSTTLATYTSSTSATYTMTGTYYSSVTINLIYTKTAHTFSIAYNKNGGSGTMSNTTGVTYNSSSTLKSNAFTRGGYIFKEWNTQADGKGTSYNPGSITVLQVNDLYPGTSGGTRTLYAIWTSGEAAAITFATNFNTNIGGTCVYGGGTNVEDLAKAWSEESETYSGLADYVKYWLDKSHASSNTNVINMFAKYDYVYGKYYDALDEDDFLNRNPAKLSSYRDFSPFNIMGGEDNFSTIIIVIASSVALLSVTALSILVIRKRKIKE